MEQKLAEFRARRQAENAVRKDESAAPPCRGHTVADTADTTADSQQTEERTENISESTQSSPSKVRHNQLRGSLTSSLN